MKTPSWGHISIIRSNCHFKLRFYLAWRRKVRQGRYSLRDNQLCSSKTVCFQQNLNQMMSDHTHSTCNQTSSSTWKKSVISNVTETQTRSTPENQTVKPKASENNHLESKKHVSNSEPTNENALCKLNKYAFTFIACFIMLQLWSCLINITYAHDTSTLNKQCALPQGRMFTIGSNSWIMWSSTSYIAFYLDICT